VNAGVLGNAFEWLRQRIRSRPDTEFQQALIRFCVGIILYLYFATSFFQHSSQMSGATHLIATLFLVFASLLLAWCVLDGRVSPIRRISGALIDFSGASIVLILSNETGAPIVAVYLWVILGNGFRYGVPYLFFSTVLAVIGFGLVLIYGDFWRTHLALGLGILFAIIVVPLYSATLLGQLHRAIAREKEANLAKSMFLANMSHELRTPLNGVIGVADLLNETRLDREQKELAQIIRSSAETLLGLIENVLDISRIEAGRLILNQEYFDLHLLVSRTVSMLEPAARKKGLALAAHIAPQTPYRLHGDAKHLRQILINLLGNAIKFTHAGRVDLYIRPVGQGQPPTLYFEVVDTGIGIPEAAQKDIFESFTQADAGITRRYGGTGLGTTIARQLTELMGGSMGFRSTEGLGSVFWFEIPFQPPEAEAAPELQEGMQGRVVILARGDTHERIAGLVRGWGMEVNAVSNGQALRTTLQAMNDAQPLAAIVVESDCIAETPEALIAGLDLATRHHTPPIILLGGAGPESPGLEARLTRAGYSAVLGKPINPSLLFNAIHAAMSAALPDNVVSIAERFQSKAGAVTLRVLVADDNPVNQRVTRGLMEHAGHVVVTADDGEEALNALEFQEQPIDLAIIDMQMPGLSGNDVVRRWRFMEEGHLPIIILTADAREETARECLAAGADVFLTKPVNSRDLIDTVARLALSDRGEVEALARPAVQRGPVVLDETVLDDLASLGGGPDFVAGLVQEFSRDSLRAFEAVEQAMAARDYPVWKDHFHMLKGGASDVGALALAQACMEAERLQPYEIGTQVARDRLGQVRAACTEALTALTEYLSRQSSVRGR